MCDDWIELLEIPLDVSAAVSFVTHDDAGGIGVFLGTTRAERHADGRTLAALDYEAFTGMAIEQLRRLAGTARERWPVIRVAMLHRVGRVEVGQASVLIAVSTPHRAESFDACRF